jgi:FkbM family methyltransferase
MRSELTNNPDARFTRAVVAANLLRSPIVLVDVGVNGGILPRWRNLGSSLEVHGFDPLEEVIAPLRGDGHSYYVMALGDEEGERDFYVSADTYSSSLYTQGESKYASGPAACVGSRRVPIRRLDSLMAEGKFSRADFLKVDTEGFEPEVLKGARSLLGSVLALDIETNFSTSPILPKTHFWGVYENLLPDFTVQDMAFNRIPRAGFVNAGGTETIARPATFNILFAREPRSQDETLRLAIIFELYGLMDTAYDLAMAHPEASRFAHHLILKPAKAKLRPISLRRYARGLLRRLAAL